MADQLIIFDTTLRDGEQSPGASMTKDEKLRIARHGSAGRLLAVAQGGVEDDQLVGHAGAPRFLSYFAATTAGRACAASAPCAR